VGEARKIRQQDIRGTGHEESDKEKGREGRSSKNNGRKRKERGRTQQYNSSFPAHSGNAFLLGESIGLLI
jgi:hypothetical protein